MNVSAASCVIWTLSAYINSRSKSKKSKVVSLGYLGLTNANHKQHSTTTSCHAGQRRYAYTVTQDSNNQVQDIAQKAARNRRRPGAANIRSGGPIPRKHSPDGATWHAYGNQACYSFKYLGGSVGLVGWPIADGLPT